MSRFGLKVLQKAKQSWKTMGNINEIDALVGHQMFICLELL